MSEKWTGFFGYAAQPAEFVLASNSMAHHSITSPSAQGGLGLLGRIAFPYPITVAPNSLAVLLASRQRP